jgi:hypothetical protein
MKRFISLLLVFSVLALSVPITAKEKKGADLIIQRTDGTHVRGELIAVKENSLLLLERESGADLIVDMGEIVLITIMRKSKALLGAGIGALIGGGGGVIFAGKGDLSDRIGWNRGPFFAVCAGVGLLIGGIVGAVSGIDKKVKFEGKSDAEIQEILEKLRKKARICNSQ